MDLSCLAAIESCANELARAARSLADYCQTQPASSTQHQSSTGIPSVAADAPSHVHRARTCILTSTAKLQTLIGEPRYFLQRLASQNQLLACLRWLGEFQILACIPLQGSVPVKDISELTGVPESVLMRVVRMTSTAKFLCEPQSGHVAHTVLSAEFVTTPSLVDAARFIAGETTRAALHMSTATQRYGEPDQPEHSAYALSLPKQVEMPQSFQLACNQSPKLQRQWLAYFRSCADKDESVAEGLSLLEWDRQKSVCIIESSTSPSCIAHRIAARHSLLQITVQRLSEPTLFESGSLSPSSPSAPSYQPFLSSLSDPLTSPRISVQRRLVGQTQVVLNADVYILHLGSPSISPSESLNSLTTSIKAELRAHLPILRDGRGAATLVVVMRLLPEPGSVSPEAEAVSRMHDLVLLQLVNERDLELNELIHLIQAVGDDSGSLKVVNRARARDNAVIALGVKFQPAAR